jgi:AraC family transcriptional regulator
VKALKILRNQNKLYSETTNEAFYNNEQSDFSIRMVTSGIEEYRLDHKTINVFPGYFLVLNDGTNYQRKIYTDRPSNTFSVQFSKNFLADYNRSLSCNDEELMDVPFDGTEKTPVFYETLYPLKNDLMFNLLHLKNHFDKKVNNELLLNEYLYHSLLLFYQVHYKEVLIGSRRLNFVKPCTRRELFKRLNNVKDYMISNCDQVISIEDLTNVACLSECHLYKLFKELYQCSPHQYLVKIRLNRAKALLGDTNYPVNEIIGMVGFESASSFIRLFKKNFALTPQSYRAKNSA